MHGRHGKQSSPTAEPAHSRTQVMNQMTAQPRQFCAGLAERTLRAHENLSLSDFAASCEREGDTGMKTVSGNENPSQPKTARSN
jgi:hypothetical protein